MIALVPNPLEVKTSFTTSSDEEGKITISDKFFILFFKINAR